MKFSSFHTFLCLALLSVAGSSLTGCGKLKTLIARRPNQPTPTPGTAAVASDGSSPSPGGAVAASAGAAAGPAHPVAPAINKNAAVMVLCYHRLEEHPRPHDPLAMTPEEFTKEMQALKDNNFAVIPMQDFLAWRRGEKEIPPKCCVVSIDDGYVSGYDTAWPILKKFGYPFTMFVYINYIGAGGKSITWDQLAEMRDAGVDIESHTYYHSNLRSPGTGVDKPTHVLVERDMQTLGPDGFLRKEIVESKQILEQKLGIKVNCLAYPYGNWSSKVRDLVKEAGYEAAFTVYGQRLGHSTTYDILGRYAVEQDNPKIFQEALAMQGGGGGGAPAASSNMEQFAATSMITQPMQGETVSNSKPLIKANIAAMGDVDPKTVEMRLSGYGKVPAQYDAQTKTVTYQVTQPLKDKNYSVILSAAVGGKPAETRWDFNFDPAKAAPAPQKAVPPKL